LYRRLGGPQRRSGCRGVEKNSQPLSGREVPIIQPVAQRYTTVGERLTLHMRVIKPRICCDAMYFSEP